MEEKNAYYSSLETLGLCPTREPGQELEESRRSRGRTVGKPVKPAGGNKQYQRTEGRTLEEGKTWRAGRHTIRANQICAGVLMTNSLEKCPLTLSERIESLSCFRLWCFLKEAVQNRRAHVQKDPAYPKRGSLIYMFRLLLFIQAVNTFLINLRKSFCSPQFRFLTTISSIKMYMI